MKDVLFLDNMLTPKLITAVYWLSILAAIGMGLQTMFTGYGGFTAGKFFLGILFMGGGAIGARIYCELLIVLFKMNEALQDLRRR